VTTKTIKTTTTVSARFARRLGHTLTGLGIALAATSIVATVACKTGTGGTTVPGPTPGQNPDPAEPTETKVARKYPAPPPPTAPKPVNFPDVASFRLANGLAVYVIENHEVPIVTTQLVIRCGTMDDPYLAEFTAQMLGEGTRSRSKARLDEAIEFVGGTLGASTGTHVTTVFARSLDIDLKLAVLLMADEVLNPVFPSAALDKLKQRSKTGLRISRSSPDALADTLFGMSVFPEGHPYGRPLATEAQIDAISIADVRSFHETFYRANNAFLLLSGDITAAEARPLVASPATSSPRSSSYIWSIAPTPSKPRSGSATWRWLATTRTGPSSRSPITCSATAPTGGSSRTFARSEGSPMGSSRG